MTMLDDRLDRASTDVRRVVDRIPASPAGSVAARHRRRRAGAVSAVVALIAGSLLGLGLLTEGATRDVARGEPVSTTTAGPTTTSSSPSAGEVVEAAVWAETFLPSVVEVGLDADSTEFHATMKSLAEGGWVWATARDDESGSTLTGVFRGFAPGEYHDDEEWFRQIADSTLAGRTVGDGADRAILGTEAGVIVIESSGVSAGTAPDARSLDALANQMAFTAYQLMGLTPPQTQEQLEPTAPAEEDWIQIAPDIWIAFVPEDDAFGDQLRLWLKSDLVPPVSAPSTDTRSITLRAGSDEVVLVFGSPRSSGLTMVWQDGESKTVDLVWNHDVGVGIARTPYRDSGLVDVIEVP